MTYGPDEFAKEFGISREVADRFGIYDATLLEWSSRHNLVSRSTIEDRWSRHYRDSAQLYRRIPSDAKTLLDLGSGAGFPGLVLAVMGAERKLEVSLVESIGKKAAFLSAAAEAMALKTVSVIPERIESITIYPPDIVTARALAQLGKLLGYAHEIAGERTTMLFPKGQDVEVELTDAAKYWHMDVVKHPSVTSPGSTILEIRRLRPVRRQFSVGTRKSREK
ncbi:MAG: 16S rRNA (guanine(527)-N(7))-methyltransferase RsmG [Parvularculaceae bacterium]|nr:16S rRNA (guanine(527)-N(7))-methyltransferase RsmG [Parvularculaceae bacterium]